jgi:hypothetical protein
MNLAQAAAALRTLSLSQSLVLLLLLGAIPLTLLASRTRLRLSPLRQRVAIPSVRLAVVCLLILALAQPTLRPGGHGRAVVFAVDSSDSISPDQLRGHAPGSSGPKRRCPPAARPA